MSLNPPSARLRIARKALMNLQEATELLDRVELLLERTQRLDAGIDISLDQALIKLVNTRQWVADGNQCLRIDFGIGDDVRFERDKDNGYAVVEVAV